MGFFNVLNQMINAEVIKAHTVDQPFGFDQTEQAWLVVTRLRTRGNCTDFDGAKPHRPQCINALAIFIQTGRETQRVLKRQAHAVDRFFRHVLTHQRSQWRAGDTTQLLECKFMSALRIELEKGFTNERVVHELSWIPGVQTGRGLSAILPGKGIDLWQKMQLKKQTFPLQHTSYAISCSSLADKSFSGITRRCHTPENCYEC